MSFAKRIMLAKVAWHIKRITLTLIISVRDDRNIVLFRTIQFPSCNLLVCIILATCLKARGKARYRRWLFVLRAIQVCDAMRGICAFASRGARPHASTCIRNRPADASDS